MQREEGRVGDLFGYSVSVSGDASTANMAHLGKSEIEWAGRTWSWKVCGVCLSQLLFACLNYCLPSNVCP